MKCFFKVCFLMVFVVVLTFFFVSCGGEDTVKVDNDNNAGGDDTQVGDTGDEDSDESENKEEYCGNGVVDPGEECDGGVANCVDLNSSYTGGIAICNDECKWDYSSCAGGKEENDDDDGDDDGDDDNGHEDPLNVTLIKHVIDDNPFNPAFVTVVDLDQDGYLDIITAEYGPMGMSNMSMEGKIQIYYGTGDINNWNKVEVDTGIAVKFPHPPVVADINGNGHLDMIIPAGFLACEANPLGGPCGALFWLENDGSQNWTRHDIVPMGDEHFYFWVEYVDFDGDGIKDIVTTGERFTKNMLGQVTNRDEILMWFKGTEDGILFDTTKRIISDNHGGPFPRVVDVNGNGKLDIVAAQYFIDPAEQPSFVWLERISIDEWIPHTINDDSGEGFQMDIVDDLYGDGVRRAVGTNHTNTSDNANAPAEGLFIFDIPDDPTQPWPKKVISNGIKSRKSPSSAPQSAPGVFGLGDLTGNGLLDIALSGDGDARIFWYQQVKPGQFVQHILGGEPVGNQAAPPNSDYGQAGGMIIADLDGDGQNELIVTLYEGNKLLVYKVEEQ